MKNRPILLLSFLFSVILFAEPQDPINALITKKVEGNLSKLLSNHQKFIINKPIKNSEPIKNIVIKKKNHIETTIEKEKNRKEKNEKNKSKNKTDTKQNTKETKTEKKAYDLKEVSKNLEESLKKTSPILKEIKNKKFLTRFYRQNNYQPLWIESNGFGKKVSSLFKAIEADATITQKSKLYNDYTYMIKYMKNSNIHIDPIRTEIKLTQLYIDFLKQTLYGEINWKRFSKKLSALKRKKINGTWSKDKAPFILSELLLKQSIPETIEEITTHNFSHNELLLALEKLKKIKKKGGWKKLPNFKVLKLGDQGNNVIKLRERLEISGDLKECEIDSNRLFEKDIQSEQEGVAKIKFQPRATFDNCLEEAVKKFQKRHGLDVDGVVGKGTQKSMNQTVDYKIQKVLLNLDRIKWLPRDIKDKYIIVNIPEYMLHYIDKGQTKQKIRVIVGNKTHPTPIFHNEISFIVLNPYWRVPEGIVRREIIPHVLKNPNYLKKQGLEIHQTWNERSPRINPESIYWQQYASGVVKFPYRIMQPPSKKNALGKIKFKFPNRYAVYLHDTPTRYLFKRDKRAFSHGCVRISQPKALLNTIATFNSNINLKKADKILKGKRQKQINIKNKLPIYIVYLTAGFNMETKELEFREDIYNYDKMQDIDKY